MIDLESVFFKYTSGRLAPDRSVFREKTFQKKRLDINRPFIKD